MVILWLWLRIFLMIELKPEIFNSFPCPECNSVNIRVTNVLFPGIHILADCICDSCKFGYLHDFPIGHSLFYPTVFGKENSYDYSKESFDWFHKALINAYKSKNNQVIIIEKIIYKDYKRIIILNCLDYLYGHVLLKLFNAQLYLEKYYDLGLVIILPKNFKWLIPEGVAEIWLVDIKLSEAREWFVKLDTFIKHELLRFDRVFLSLAYSHPDFSTINISKFTKVEKFNIDNFGKNPITITFISREDRFWVNSKFELYLFYFLKKLKLLRFTKLYFVTKQNRKISRLFNILKKEYPKIKFYVVGIGKGGKFPISIIDKRVKIVLEKNEVEWCKIYSESSVVIGIHGSNMLLPSALAGGVIEILPESRLGNITQDIASYYCGNFLLYLCRFVHEFVKPRGIAAIVISMINNYEYFLLNSSLEKSKNYLNNRSR